MEHIEIHKSVSFSNYLILLHNPTFIDLLHLNNFSFENS